MAMGARLRNQQRRFFCLTSDGELNEGSVWEAALFISHQKLTNVIWLIDRNGLQGIGRTEDVIALEPLDEKLRSFGFHVTHADGHDFDSLLAAQRECIEQSDIRRIPAVIICKTTKGRGLGMLQDTVDCHYLPLTDDQYNQALTDLEVNYRKVMQGVIRES